MTWDTNIPATSQVELLSDTARPAKDDHLVTEHRVVLTGLAPGATYRFRVRSIGLDGGIGTSAESPLTTAPAGSGPEVASVSVRQLTSTTARLGWATSTGTVAQVEYGASANYGGFTLLKVFTSPAQEMLLSGLHPGTTHHFRIKAWDGDGFLGASVDGTFTTAVAGLATLLGDSRVETERVTLAEGQAAAYQYIAAQSGQASLVRLYVDSGSSTPVIRVALYSDEGGTPGAILSQGSAPALIHGWIDVSLPPVPLLKDTRYWLVVLSPIGSGSVVLRDLGLGGSSMLSAQTTLAALPRTWTAGSVAVRSPLSAYVQQVPPAITLMGPAEASVVTGRVPLSAVVDDDAPIVRLQFLVDGEPAGPSQTAEPYSAVWDTRESSPTQLHMISARATDLLGRSTTSGVVSVQVDNGPLISKVTVSPGLTSTSARITWITDVLADGQVEYGPTASYGRATPIDTRVDWRHDMQLTGLAAASTYHYRVRSRDATGALAVSADQTFFTSDQ
ncbi:MAG: hypothetical protein E6I52_08655 [Chloroflexi bacterium]|nr:MAG: hypothetical protein E6I52_08655 [Chloroflexota bacterium]